MDNYLRKDFRAMPEVMQRGMLKLLAYDDKNTPSFWLDTLLPEPLV